MLLVMQIEPWHDYDYAHGIGPTPKFVKIWRLFVYLNV